MATRSQWIAGARPRTLPAAIAPVLLGSSIAEYDNSFRLSIAFCALIVALALQIGVNYANDYSDGIRGTDTVRVGPVRLVGQQLAAAETVKRAAGISFCVAGIAGVSMAFLSGLWLLILIGLSAIIAAWFYTGGTRPYGYAGFGEFFVFVYFGLVAVCGTSASQIGHITPLSILAGISCGLLSTAILIANNLRDIPNDSKVGKRTLAVRLGDQLTRKFYVLAITLGIALVIPMSLNGPRLAFVGLFSLLVAVEPIRLVSKGTTGRALIPVLVGTGRTLIIFSLIVSFGIINS